MKPSSHKKFFTLIELLIVIAIIGVIVSISMVSFSNIRQKGRDTKRISDIKLIQKSLEDYYRNEGSYPASLTPGQSLIGSSSNVVYMQIPQNPAPKNDGNCPDSEYSYRTTNDGRGYELSFCLSETTAQLNAGEKCATPQGIKNETCSFRPSDLSDLKLWLEADTGITKDTNNLVSSWQDQSGNANNAIQNTEPNRPLLVAGQLNSKPVLRFDGVDDWMGFNEITDIRTAFLVIKHKTGTSAEYEPILGHHSLYNFAGNVGTGLYSEVNIAAGIRTYYGGKNYINNIEMNSGDMIKPTNYTIYSLISSSDVTAEYITNDRNAPGRYWNGDYAEIIIYNQALSDTDRQKVENYLKAKYAL